MLIAAVLTRQAISVSKRNASIVFLADSRLIALLRPPDAPKQRKNAVSVFQGTLFFTPTSYIIFENGFSFRYTSNDLTHQRRSTKCFLINALSEGLLSSAGISSFAAGIFGLAVLIGLVATAYITSMYLYFINNGHHLNLFSFRSEAIVGE